MNLFSPPTTLGAGGDPGDGEVQVPLESQSCCCWRGVLRQMEAAFSPQRTMRRRLGWTHPILASVRTLEGVRL